ncbi:MAG: hypothetical protein OCD01_15630 [Fibrobacterales bacterium]
MEMIKQWFSTLTTRSALTYYLAIIGISIIVGLINNVRVADEKSVTWFGGQEVLEKPPEFGEEPDREPTVEPTSEEIHND